MRTSSSESRWASAADPWFHCELWLSVRFRGEVLWAYNASHLALLRAYIGAALRERGAAAPHPNSGDRIENMTMAAKLPKWLKAADNREPLLALINELERKAV